MEWVGGYWFVTLELLRVRANISKAQMFFADGGKSIQKLLEPANEPLRPEMEGYNRAQELGVYDMWQLQIKRTELCKEYLDRWNACKGMDGILCMRNCLSVKQYTDNFMQAQRHLTAPYRTETSNMSAILASSTFWIIPPSRFLLA